MGEGERREAELRKWERLARMHNPDWAYKSRMYARLLFLACRRIRELEAELRLYIGDGGHGAGPDSGSPTREVE